MRSALKLLFLDVDGVLNDRATLVAASRKLDGRLVVGQHEQLRNMIEPKYVMRVNTLLEATGARVVLSSTWRKLFKGEMPEILEFFKSVGFDTSTWLGRTPDGYPGQRFSMAPQRGMEIQRFISAMTPVRDVSSIVILDDNTDMAHLKHRLIKTDGWETGITEADVAAAIELFNTKDDAHITFDWKQWERNR